MSELTEKLREMASIETSSLYSQRKTLNEAADRIDQLEEFAEAFRRMAADKAQMLETSKRENRMIKLFWAVVNDEGDVVANLETEREAAGDAAYRSVKDGRAYVIYRCEMVNTVTANGVDEK